MIAVHPHCSPQHHPFCTGSLIVSLMFPGSELELLRNLLPPTHVARKRETSIKSNPTNGCPPLFRLHFPIQSESMGLAWAASLLTRSSCTLRFCVGGSMMYGLLWKTHSNYAANKPAWGLCGAVVCWKLEVGTGPYTEQCFNLFMLNQINIIPKF